MARIVERRLRPAAPTKRVKAVSTPPDEILNGVTQGRLFDQIMESIRDLGARIEQEEGSERANTKADASHDGGPEKIDQVVLDDVTRSFDLEAFMTAYEQSRKAFREDMTDLISQNIGMMSALNDLREIMAVSVAKSIEVDTEGLLNLLQKAFITRYVEMITARTGISEASRAQVIENAMRKMWGPDLPKPIPPAGDVHVTVDTTQKSTRNIPRYNQQGRPNRGKVPLGAGAIVRDPFGG